MSAAGNPNASTSPGSRIDVQHRDRILRAEATLAGAGGDGSEEFRICDRQPRHDAVAATAPTVVRRALIEGMPVTREVVEREASVNLGASPKDALQQVDLVAQRPGVPSLG